MHLSRDDMHLVLIRGYQPYPVEINALILNGVIGQGPTGARGTMAGVRQLIDDMVQEVNVINLDRSPERFRPFFCRQQASQSSARAGDRRPRCVAGHAACGGHDSR